MGVCQSRKILKRNLSDTQLFSVTFRVGDSFYQLSPREKSKKENQFDQISVTFSKIMSLVPIVNPQLPNKIQEKIEELQDLNSALVIARLQNNLQKTSIGTFQKIYDIINFLYQEQSFNVSFPILRENLIEIAYEISNHKSIH